MSKPYKLLMALVIAGMFLVPPAVGASGSGDGKASADAQSPLSASEPVQPSMQADRAALLTGTSGGTPRPAVTNWLDTSQRYVINPGIAHSSGGRGPRAAPEIYIAWNGVHFVPPPAVDMWYGAGAIALKGASTQWNITINNSGDADTTDAAVTVRYDDAFGKEMSHETSGQFTVAMGGNYTVYFQQVPTYATYFSINITLSCTGDSDTTNNQVEYDRILVGFSGNNPVYEPMTAAFWADTCANQGAWTDPAGGIGGNGKWHITDTIQADNDTQHTAPNAWWEGNDMTTRYEANSDISMRQTFDLRNFGTYWFLHFDYLFHGSLPAADNGDYFVLEASTDNGATWDEVAKIDGPMLAAQPAAAAAAATGWITWVTSFSDGSQTLGLDITWLGGKQVQLRQHFVSNAINQDTGFYFDDFLIWGMELQYDVGVEMASEPADARLNTDVTLKAKVTNYRQGQPAAFNCVLNITKRGIPTQMLPGFPQTKQVNALAPGASQEVTFDAWKPAEKGDFVIVINLTGCKDESPLNNRTVRWVHVSDLNPRVLVVDDDPFGGGVWNTDKLIDALINVSGYEDYGRYWTSRFTEGDGPSADIMKKYDLVIWNTGWDTKNFTSNGTLTAADQNSIKSYLNTGGSFWLVSMGAFNDLGANTFMTQTLHVKSGQNDTQLKGEEFSSSKQLLPNPINGTPGSLADGAVYSTAPPTGTNWSYDMTDIIQPAADATGVFYANETGATGEPTYVAVQYAGAYRLVYQTFDFGFVQFENDRNDFVLRVVRFLTGGLTMEVAGLAPFKQIVDPGGTAVFTMYINNTGTKARTIATTIVGDVPNGWTAVLDPNVTNEEPYTVINPNDGMELTLTVTAPPQAPAGDRADLGINVSFKDYAMVLFNRTITEVRAIVETEMTAAVTAQNITGAGAVSYPFTLRNKGNVQLIAELTKTGDHPDWLTLSLPSVLLLPYEPKSLTALMSVPEGAFREAGNYTLKNTLTSRVTYQNTIYNSSLNFTTTVRVAQVFSAKIDDFELTPDGGLADMSLAKPSVKVSVKVSAAKANGYDNVTIELKAKSFTPTGNPSRSWDGTGWNLPKTVMDTTPFMYTGKTSDLTVFVPPKTDAGDYTIELRVIPGNGKLTDGDTTTVVIKVAKPDLTVASLTFSPVLTSNDAELGTPVKIRAAIKNIGGAKAGNIDVSFYSSGENLIETKTIAELAASTGSTTVEITWDAFVEGENVVTVKVDPNGKLSEVSTDNNMMEETLIGLRSDIVIDSAPLFKIAGVSKPSVTEGDTMQIEVTVKNVGNFGLNLSNVVVQLTDSTGDVLTQTIQLLQTRSEVTVTFNWVARKTGTHTMIVKVNPDGNIKEKDANNNEVSGTVKVVPPPKDGGDGVPLEYIAIGAVVAVAAVVGVALMMRRKPPQAPASAPVEAPAAPAEEAVVVAEEEPAAEGGR